MILPIFQRSREADGGGASIGWMSLSFCSDIKNTSFNEPKEWLFTKGLLANIAVTIKLCYNTNMYSFPSAYCSFTDRKVSYNGAACVK